MKVLLITGLLAEDLVKKYSKETDLDVEVLALKVPVAAFLSPKILVNSLKDLKLDRDYVILVPGLMRGDVSVVMDTLDRPVLKGPRYAADLPIVLEFMQKVELSTRIPADDLLREEFHRMAFQELENVERDQDELLKKPGNILIKELAIGKDFPMRVMAEIVDAPLLNEIDIQKLAKRYVKFGAEIIDVGMIAGENRPADATRAVKAIRSVVSVPVSIDTLNPDEAKAAVSAGADLILSVDAGNVKEMASFADRIAVVAIPTNQREGYFPNKVEERVDLLEAVIKKARELGITKIVGDLVLEPSNVLKSMLAFREFAKKNPYIPLFIGISNFTELIDADSVGINALLTRLSSEAGVNLLLATEKSNKTKGSIGEVAMASKMMFLAKKRGTVPKDLGLDLLILKDKRNREEPYNRKIEKETKPVSARREKKIICHDAKGAFKISLDRPAKEIVAINFSSSKPEKPINIIKGRTAESVYRQIIKMCLVTRLDHVAYLGSELGKAEIALKTGKEYIQDTALFKHLL